jgi:ribosomal protein L32
MDLAIKINPEAEHIDCASCGDEILAHRGPALFKAGTKQIICRSCGEDHTPHLIALLDLSDAAARYIRTREYKTTHP